MRRPEGQQDQRPDQIQAHGSPRAAAAVEADLEDGEACSDDSSSCDPTRWILEDNLKLVIGKS